MQCCLHGKRTLQLLRLHVADGLWDALHLTLREWVDPETNTLWHQHVVHSIPSRESIFALQVQNCPSPPTACLV